MPELRMPFARSRKPRIGLALSAGGAKGAAFIPFLKALEDMDIRPSIIAGASVGAMIGGFYAAGVSPGKSFSIIQSLGRAPGFQVYDPHLRMRSLLKGNKAYEFIKLHLPVETFEETRIPLRVVAVDFWRREQVVFSSGSLADAIRASISIPGVFDPFIMDDRVLIDGGIMNPVPWDLIQDECDFVIALHLSEDDEPKTPTEIPQMLPMMIGTVRTMRDTITAIKREYNPPHYYRRIGFADVGTLDFGKWREIIAQAETEIPDFQVELARALAEQNIRV